MIAPLGLVMLLAQPPAPPADLQQTLANIHALIAAGQASQALEKLQALPLGDARVRYLRGVAFYHLDDPVKAIDALAPVAHSLPDGSVERKEAVQVLALSYYMAGRLKEAVPLLEETRAWASDNVELSQVLGMAYIQTSQNDKARVELAETFGVPPESASAHLLTAQMMVRLEFNDAAETEVQRALAMNAALPQANYLLGVIAISRAQVDQGIAFFRKELVANPLNAIAE